ncbi:MAG TPA: hypothetical protein VHM30_17310 [Gemmatimonadaceae bacterium]|nr:hypothetical protein [Gemmatimonadaceae bacterium]
MSSYDRTTTAGRILRLTSWRFRIGFGAAVFATAAMVMLVTNGQPGSGSTNNNRVLALSIAMAVDVWLVLAILSGKGRRVALGFLCGVVGMAIVRPAIGGIWAMPMAAAVDATRPAWAPIAAASARSAAEESWVGARRAEIPVVVHAQRLANQVHECVARYRAVDSLASYPRRAAEVTAMSNCADLVATRADNDSVPTRFTDADFGWRWSYTPGAADPGGRVTSYVVRVFEDPAIGRPSPQYLGDESGVVRELAPGKAPGFAASPVQALVQLRRCLQRVPAFHEKEEARYGYPRERNPMYEVLFVCPELKGHVYVDIDDRDKNILAVPARPTPGEFVDTASVYQVEFIPADVAGLVFELQVRPWRSRNPYVHSGIRRFFVARDGSIHVATGQGNATAGDPLVAECSEGVPEACGDSPPTPSQLPGS